MAKTAPLKKKGSTSIHSRAAKRASSPSIDTDKSLKNVQPPTESKTSKHSVLAVHQGAGVSKKSKNGRKAALSAKAKRRQEKSMDMAEAVMDRKEMKIEKSKGRARSVQERAKAWEELNKKALAKKEAEEKADREKDNWVDEDGMEEDDAEDFNSTAHAGKGEDDAMIADVEPQSVPLPEPTEEEEIL